MYTGLIHLHSTLRWILLLLIVATIVNALIKTSKKADFKEGDRKLGLFALIATHLQLIVGLVLYFVSPKGASAIGEVGMGEIMKTAELRYFVVEHLSIMIIAIALITVGYSKAKRATESGARFKAQYLFYGIGLILMLSRIPSWGF